MGLLSLGLGMGLLSLGLGVAKSLLFCQILFRMCCRLAFPAAVGVMRDLPTASGNATGSEAPPLARTPLSSTTTGLEALPEPPDTRTG